MINIEIADNPNKWQTGLMFRKNLDQDNGMLFVFKKSQILKFWGLNTYLSLDIAFIDEDKNIIKIDKIKPLSMKTVSSDKPCLMALEVNDGYFSNNGIKEGDKIEIKKEKDKDVVIIKK